MRILVTFAVEAEFAPWSKLRQFHEKHVAAAEAAEGFKVFETTVADHTVWVHLTGIGGNRLSALAPGAQAAGVDFVISSGLAGALRKQHDVGEVIAPRYVGVAGDAVGLAADSRLLRLAGAHGAKLVDAMLTTDHVVESGDEKNRLGLLADAVDMESSRIMREFAFGRKIPVVAIRAISDGSGEDLPLDFGACLTTDGKLKPLPLLKCLLDRPSKIPGLIRFGVRSRKAASNLTRFLDSFLSAMTPEDMIPEAMKSDLGAIAE